MPDDNKLGIFEHLDELRKRLIICAVIVTIGFLVCFIYSGDLFNLLRLPLDYQIKFFYDFPFLRFIESVSENNIHFIAPAEVLWVHLKIALVFSVLLSAPVIITQTWLFIKPALFPDEKKLALPFIFSSLFLFVTGLLFCFLIVLPFAINFLLTYKTQNLVPMLTLERYVDFTLKFILSFGLIFQTPVVIVLLTRLNILTPKILREKRKYAVLIIFIMAAILTPTPDIFNQFIMALPLMLLYEISIIISEKLYKNSKVSEK